MLQTTTHRVNLKSKLQKTIDKINQASILDLIKKGKTFGKRKANNGFYSSFLPHKGFLGSGGVFYKNDSEGIITETNDGEYTFQYDKSYIQNYPDRFNIGTRNRYLVLIK